MEVFNIKSVLEWKPLAAGELLEFPVNSNARNVTLMLNTTQRVDVYLAFSDDLEGATLLASSDGLFTVSATIGMDCYIFVDMPEDAKVFYSDNSRSQKVEPSPDAVSFTSVIPQGRRNSDLDRIMRLVSVNEERRDRQLKNTLDAMKADNIKLQEQRLAEKAERDAERAKRETVASEPKPDEAPLTE